jgi:hypothetical protein
MLLVISTVLRNEQEKVRFQTLAEMLMEDASLLKYKAAWIGKKLPYGVIFKPKFSNMSILHTMYNSA